RGVYGSTLELWTTILPSCAGTTLGGISGLSGRAPPVGRTLVGCGPPATACSCPPGPPPNYPATSSTKSRATSEANDLRWYHRLRTTPSGLRAGGPAVSDDRQRQGLRLLFHRGLKRPGCLRGDPIGHPEPVQGQAQLRAMGLRRRLLEGGGIGASGEIASMCLVPAVEVLAGLSRRMRGRRRRRATAARCRQNRDCRYQAQYPLAHGSPSAGARTEQRFGRPHSETVRPRQVCLARDTRTPTPGGCQATPCGPEHDVPDRC